MPVDDPRLNLLLDEYMRDRRDGVSLRSVHNRVTGVQREFEKERLESRERFARVEAKLEATEKREAREDLADAIADANGTGRHMIATPQAFTPAFGVQVPPELRQPAPSHAAMEPRRESGFFASTWRKLKKYLSHALAGLIAALFTLGISWLGAHGCSTAQTIQAASDRPATTSVPKMPLPFPQEQPTKPGIPSMMPDAGR